MRICVHIVLSALLLAGCAEKGKKPEQGGAALTVAIAANVQFAMEEIKAAFEQQSGMHIDLISSSSGKLSTQIRQGAPYHVFVSADTKYPDSLVQSGDAVASPRVYAFGTLVLWTMQPTLDLASGMAVLEQEGIKKIALANPMTAPYGEEAIRVLTRAGQLDAVQHKLVYGESIGQASQYILSGACELGFTAKSVVLAPEMQGKGQWMEVAADLYEPIAQAAVITAYGQKNQPTGSRAFYDFLFSPKAQAIFSRYGYRLP
ncbi:MAG: molybdate ABC transporter substrate-binding protein [Haliscomenobacter sp.]